MIKLIYKGLGLLTCIFITANVVYGASNTDASIKALLSKRMDIAIKIIEKHFDMASSGEVTTDIAKKQALVRLSELRFNENEYIWVFKPNLQMLMHPIAPRFNGKYFHNVKDPSGSYIFRNFLEASRKDGFSEYVWPKMENEKPSKVVAYIHNYQPWGWLIGTSKH